MWGWVEVQGGRLPGCPGMDGSLSQDSWAQWLAPPPWAFLAGPLQGRTDGGLTLPSASSGAQAVKMLMITGHSGRWHRLA